MTSKLAPLTICINNKIFLLIVNDFNEKNYNKGGQRDFSLVKTL